MGRLAGCLDENTVVAFAEGRVAPGEIARVDDHVAGCAQCRRLVAAALELRTHERATGTTTGHAAGLSLDVERGRLQRGATVGRYTILAMAGHGAMGEVYAAYDGDLDRKVAFKVLRTHRGDDVARGHARLLREARALARLSHPNVVAVHDVGTFDERVFVAMEFVDGVTLQEWLAGRPRGREEILGVFASAARGLAAAHAVGLVHRDFKPGNVMVARDGTVRVLDFGLARHIGDEPAGPEAPEAAAPVEGPRAPATFTLTATGEILGTPRYMAPEQMRAAATDARTDQFSFCVSLYEALYGEPPFAGASMRELTPEVLAGRVRVAPARTKVPTWLRRVLLRGLAVQPAARWPTMETLVGALEHDPDRVRRRRGLVAGAGLLVALSSVALIRGPGSSNPLCRSGPARLAEVWEGPGITRAGRPRREAVKAALLSSGIPSPEEVGERVAAALDLYSTQWLDSFGEACRDTLVRKAQPATVMDLRMTCLEERRRALVALVDILAKADRDVASNAVTAANALPPIERCADLASLDGPVEAPRDPATRRHVDDVRARAVVVKALNDTGQHREAIAQARALVRDEARPLGYRPLLAEMLALLSASHVSASASPELAEVSEEALWTALGSGRDDIAAEMATALVFNVGYALARPEGGKQWSRLAHALLERLGAGHDLLRAWLLQNEGLLLMQTDPTASLESYGAALEIKARILPTGHPDIALSELSIAEGLHRLGRDREALSLNRRAHATLVRAFGPASLDAAQTLSNQGEYLIDLDRAPEAVPILREAEARWEAQVGTDHPNLGYPLTALGRALVATGQPDEGARILARALRLREAHEPDAALISETRGALARARAAAR